MNYFMSNQQSADDRKQQDPYPADQQFGKTAAEDQERADRGEPPTGDEPRSGNKAEEKGES
jgi:hypothetical protein